MATAHSDRQFVAYRDHTHPGHLQVDEVDLECTHRSLKAGYVVAPFLVAVDATDEDMTAALAAIGFRPTEGSTWERYAPHYSDTPADRAYAWMDVERTETSTDDTKDAR